MKKLLVSILIFLIVFALAPLAPAQHRTFAGGGSTLPADAAGALNNDGAGNRSWGVPEGVLKESSGLASALPATCTAPQVYFATDTKAYYLCSAANEWFIASQKGADGTYGITVENNTTRAPTASAYEIYPEGGVWKINTNGVEAPIAVTTRIQYKSWSFDPKAVCDGAVDRLFLMSAHGGQGIKVTGWKVSFEADPTTEADLDLKRADAWIGVGNAAVMDVLDTTAGTASEATADNINGGAAVAEGKAIYLEFGTAYTEANHQMIFEMWFYEVGN